MTKSTAEHKIITVILFQRIYCGSIGTEFMHIHDPAASKFIISLILLGCHNRHTGQKFFTYVSSRIIWIQVGATVGCHDVPNIVLLIYVSNIFANIIF